MKKENCSYYDNGHCKKGLPGTECYPIGCVAMTDKPIESLSIHYPLHPIALTWQDCKRIVEIADALTEYAEAGIIEPFLSSEEAYYKEVLKRFKGE